MSKYNVDALQLVANNCAKEWWSVAKNIFGSGIGTLPAVKMNSRLTSTAGRAFISADPAYIDLSCYLMQKYPDEFLKDTIPHELAHIIAWRMHGDRGHGKAWKLTALRLYGDNGRTHNMETLSAARKRGA